MANALNHSRHSNTLKVDADGVVHDMERNADLADFYQLREFPFDHQGLNAVLEPFRD